MTRTEHRAAAAIDRMPGYLTRPLWTAPTRIQRPARRLSLAARIVALFTSF